MGFGFHVKDSRFKIIVVVLFILWAGLMAFLWAKADIISKNPCQICAERHGEDVICSLKTSPYKITYHKNATTSKDFQKEDLGDFELKENG